MVQSLRRIYPSILISLLLISAVSGFFAAQIPRVTAADGLLIGLVNDQGVDTDSNGLFDFLKIGIELNITQTGYYSISLSELENQYFNQTAPVSDYFSSYLNPGVQVVYLSLFGPTIYASKIVNASYIYYLSAYGPYGSDNRYDVALSQKYSYYQFDNHASLTGKVYDHGVDTDADGLFNYLQLDVEINVSEPGDYSVYSTSLTSGPPDYTYIYAYGYSSAHLESGLQYIGLQLSGVRIAASGYNFTMVNSIELSETATDLEGQMRSFTLDQEYSVPLSRQYSYLEFDAAAKLTGQIFDKGIDDDNDGLFDYLQVGVQVNVSEPGTYEVSAYHLLAGINFSGRIPIFDYFYGNLDKGLQVVNVYFYGPAIYASHANPVAVAEINLYFVPEGIDLGTLTNTPLSRTYNYTEFDAHAYLTGKIYDEGVDSDQSGRYDYLQVGVEIQVQDSGYYDVGVQALSDINGSSYYEYFYSSRKTVYLEVGTRVVNFSFYGPTMAYYQFSPRNVTQITLSESYQPAPIIIDESQRPAALQLPRPTWVQTLTKIPLSRQYLYTEFDTQFIDMQAKFIVYPNGSIALGGTLNQTHTTYPNTGPQIEQSVAFGKSDGLTTVSTNGKMTFPPETSYRIPIPWGPGYMDSQASEWPFNSTVVSFASKYSGGILNAGLNASMILPSAGASMYPFNASDFSFNAAYSGGILNGVLDAQTTLPSEIASTFPFNVTDVQLVADYSGGPLKGNVTFSIISGFPLGSLTLNFEANRTDITADGSVDVLYISYPSYPNPIEINETVVDQLIGNITSLEGTGPNSLYNMTRGTIEFLNTSTITKTPFADHAIVTFDVKFHGDIVKLLANLITGSNPPDNMNRELYDLIDSAITSVQSGSITLSYAQASKAASVHITFADDLKLLEQDLFTFYNKTILESYPDYERASALMNLYLANATFSSLDSFNLQLMFNSATKTFNLQLTLSDQLKTLTEDAKNILIETIPEPNRSFIEKLLNTTYCEIQTADSSMTYQNGEVDFQSTFTIQGDTNREINYAKNVYIDTLVKSYENTSIAVPWQLLFFNQTQVDVAQLSLYYKLADTSQYWHLEGLAVAPPTDPIDAKDFRLNRFFNVTSEGYEPPGSGTRLKITVEGSDNGTNIVTMIRPSPVPAPDYAAENQTLMIWNNASISSLRNLTFVIKYYTLLQFGGQKYPIITASNGTVSPVTFDYNNKQLTLTVQGPTGTTGYANISIPRSLLDAALVDWVIVAGSKVILYPDYNITQTTTTTYLHIAFNFSSPVTLTITGTTVVSEFSGLSATPVLVILAIAALALIRKRIKKPTP